MRTKVTDLHPHRWWYELKMDRANPSEVGYIHLGEGTVCLYKCDSFVNMVINSYGKLHQKVVYGKKSKRFCTTLAKRFMAEVVELSKQCK